MRGTSQASLRSVENRFEPVLRAAGVESATLGEQLFALVDALDSSGALRRTLADPSADGEAKARLVAHVLQGAHTSTVAVAQELVRARWSADVDLTEAIEHLAFHAVLASAEATGTLERVEEDLFRVTRALAGQRDVRRILSDDATSTPEARVRLLDAILAGGATPAAALLARRATAKPRGRRFVTTLGHVGDLVAERRSRQVATVTSATELSAVQRTRLEGILERAYGQPVQLNVIVDENVLGGLRIQVGAEVVDSTVLSRLADARRRLAS
ncbi:F0F1 ATP synthase subunit delta [Cellulomonas sp. NPDC055163]